MIFINVNKLLLTITRFDKCSQLSFYNFMLAGAVPKLDNLPESDRTIS